MDERETTRIYEFGGFRLDPLRRVLFGPDNAPIALKPKAFDTLLYLVEHAQALLDKSDMIAAIWPNVLVEENNLNKNISKLRHVLGEKPDEHRFIVTEPGRGYRFVAKVRIVANESSSALQIASPPAPRARVAEHGYPLVIGLLGVVALAIVLIGHGSRGSPPRPAEVRFEIETPKTMNPLNIALSPDGRQIAYVGEGELGPALWIRALDSLEPRPLPGATGVTEVSYPFWSADSGSLLYRAGWELKRIALGAAASETIADGASRFRRGTSSPDGTVLFAIDVVYRVPASGGERVAVTQLDKSRGEIAHSAPSLLPDGRHFLYKATTYDRRNGSINVGSLDGSAPPKRLLQASRAMYAEPGFILFAREHKLFARAFDVARLEFTGDEVPIADDVAYTEVLDTSAFEASNDGTLIFRQQAPQGPDVPVVWVDRQGATVTRAGFRLPSTAFRLSADGKRVVYSEGDPPDVWVLDVSRGSRARLTDDASIDHNAVWSPDGAWVAFDSHREGKRAIYRKRADGAVPEELLYDAGPYEVQVTDWSADGRFIVFQQDSMCIGCNYDVWVLPTFGDRKPIRFTSSKFDEGYASMSADGGWIAYTTNEAGIYQVVVQPFPDPSEGKWQVSANGGMQPRWARDGRELYFFDVTGAIVRVPITIAPTFDVGEPVRVAETSGFRPWDVLADGERLITMDAGTASRGTVETTDLWPITVILNWPSLMANR